MLDTCSFMLCSIFEIVLLGHGWDGILEEDISTPLPIHAKIDVARNTLKLLYSQCVIFVISLTNLLFVSLVLVVVMELT